MPDCLPQFEKSPTMRLQPQNPCRLVQPAVEARETDLCAGTLAEHIRPRKLHTITGTQRKHLCVRCRTFTYSLTSAEVS